jgi:hypothetical protein
LLAFVGFGLILKWAVLVLPGLSAANFLLEVFILLTSQFSNSKSGWWRWFHLPGKSFATRCDARIK